MTNLVTTGFINTPKSTSIKRNFTLLTFLLLLLISIPLLAQKPVLTPRTPGSSPYTVAELSSSFNPAVIVRDRSLSSRRPVAFTPHTQARPPIASDHRITRWQAQPNATTGLPDWIRLEGPGLHMGTPTEKSRQWLAAVATSWGVAKPAESFVLTNTHTDELGLVHLSWQQQWQGIPVYGNELKTHARDGRLYLLHGRALPDAKVAVVPAIDADAALALAKTAVAKHTRYKTLSADELQLLGHAQVEQELAIFYPDETLTEAHLAWSITLVPNLAANWELIIDAHTGARLRETDHLCHFLPPTGPESTTATDLLGIGRTIHSYEWNNQNYLIDASRPMFDGPNSNFPDEAQGVIWTINGNNTSPVNDNFNTTHNVSAGNFWNDRLAVSAHYNAGEAYRYFLETFNRNSINGQGGNIISLINISEDDGSSMDNAFWNGQAMFYGNGNTAFTAPLAKALDVAGHEISHGVVQSTANLDYQGESGALNESFADIFGAMIDRNDWKMGEDVVNTNIFPTGARRDLSNPNNGGSSLNDNGWQPAHTNQQYTGSQDNGGVHINSGIPNRAFFLFATQVGKDKAEQVYYYALNQYLTRSSKFLDLRASVVQACLDRYGQAEANAAITAFNTVGIGSGGSGGTPTNTQADLAANPGEEYILYTDGNFNNLYLRTPDGELIANPLSTLDPLSKPTVTDDGRFVVFVAQDKTILAIEIDWANNQIVGTTTLSTSPVWRNAAISRDGLRLAALTDDNDNRLLVFDLSQSSVPGIPYELTNPTTSEGVATGNVLYADVLEWDHSGEYVLYDARNIIPNQNGTDIDYWDIGFIEVWNNATDDFSDGFISKLFSSLPDNTSVGNPTFAKNSPYIIALDFIDDNDGTYYLLGANTETGETGLLYQNNQLSYPSYSVQDDEIIFDATTSGDAILGTVALNPDKITAADDAFIFLDNGFAGARWGIWFANGQRQLVGDQDAPATRSWAQVFPTVSRGSYTLEWALPEASTVQAKVVDLLGRPVWQNQWRNASGPHQQMIDLTGLPTGAYILQLRAGDRQLSQRLIVAQ